MKKRAIIVWIIVIILILIALYYLVPRLIGKAVSDKFICRDTDNGKNYSVKGVIWQGDVEKGIDKCTSEIRLKEYYCLTETATIHTYYICPYKCEDGACVQETKVDEPEQGELGQEKPVEKDEKNITEPKLNFFQKIINWFKNLFK